MNIRQKKWILIGRHQDCLFVVRKRKSLNFCERVWEQLEKWEEINFHLKEPQPQQFSVN